MRKTGRSPFYIGLVHYPVYNKNMEVITTSITNLDIHDIARTARTYNMDGYYIIHHLGPQQKLASDIISYWTDGFGATYNADRKEAFTQLKIMPTVTDALRDIELNDEVKPMVITTDARVYPNTVSYSQMRNIIKETDKAILLLFGTGWGIENETMKSFDYVLEPIYGGGEYNHLSVRSAAAIIIDRLLGEEWFTQ